MLKWLKSKTIWLGLLLQLAYPLQEYFGSIGNPLGFMVVGMLVIGLRAVTTKPLSEK